MKRLKGYSFLIVSLAAALVLVSCNNKNIDIDGVSAESNTVNESEELSATITEADILGENETAEATKSTKETEVCESARNEMESDTKVDNYDAEESQADIESNIQYPVFTNIANEEQVNQLILDYINQIETRYNADDSLTLSISYQIMFQNERYISIYFSGDVEGAAYPRPFKATLNIDLVQVSRAALNNIVNLNDNFINIFSDAAQTKFESIDVNMSDVMSLDSIKETLEQADIMFDSDVQSYFTCDEVVIILGVSHVMGDYIEISIPFTSIENYII